MAVPTTHTIRATAGLMQHPAGLLVMPSLQNGDRLTRHEFERRYSAMPHIKKAELIEGTVFMSSPLKFAEHAVPHGRIIAWLSVYTAQTAETLCADNATLRIDIDNVAQPDALLCVNEKAGGRSHVAPDGYLEGAPEFIVEIAASSASLDMHDKFKVYRRAGVKEYGVWQVYEQRFDWWVFDAVSGDYRLLAADDQGIIHSEVFPGLWLNVPGLLSGNLSMVLATLQQGMESPEHAVFITSLRAHTGA
jgi:Uma2 family endonuclease